MPKLKLIHSEGVAFGSIDIKKAAEKGIYVCNNKGANAASVAEHTLMLILAIIYPEQGDNVTAYCSMVVFSTKTPGGRMLLPGLHKVSKCINLVFIAACALLYSSGTTVIVTTNSANQYLDSGIELVSKKYLVSNGWNRSRFSVIILYPSTTSSPIVASRSSN